MSGKDATPEDEREPDRYGNWTCPTCDKWTFAVIHSCPGVPQHPTRSARAISEAMREASR